MPPFFWSPLAVQQEAQETADVALLKQKRKSSCMQGIERSGQRWAHLKANLTRTRALIAAGFADGMLETEAKVDMEEYGPKLNAYLQQRGGRRKGKRSCLSG